MIVYLFKSCIVTIDLSNELFFFMCISYFHVCVRLNKGDISHLIIIILEWIKKLESCKLEICLAYQSY